MQLQRVRGQGLVNALHLDGQLGIVEELGDERLTVRSLSGLLITPKPENLTVRGLQNRFRVRVAVVLDSLQAHLPVVLHCRLLRMLLILLMSPRRQCL